jgi:hypothetical protein
MLANNICSYVDLSLAGQMDTWHLDGVSAVKTTVNTVNA